MPRTLTHSATSTTRGAGPPALSARFRSSDDLLERLSREHGGAGAISEFKQWLAEQADREDAVGRLAREWGTLWMEPDDAALPSAVRQALSEFRRR